MLYSTTLFALAALPYTFASPVPDAATATTSAASSGSTGGTTNYFPDIPTGTTYQDQPGDGRRIHPDGRSDLCLTVMGGQTTGAPNVEIAYCFSPTDDYTAPWSSLQQWNVTSPSTGQIKLQNTQYCLDAGNDPQLGDYLELQPCGNNPEGNAGQNWDWTSDSQLKTANSLCLAVQSDSHPLRYAPYGSQKLLYSFECRNSTPPDANEIFYLLD
ncbi:hypothetical protein EHS25_007574 [Saitozyma podzolica]|uniref:Ricin B lectin domain-containing protein n=1 Tax=Saitozyma podzolica TaxID=1890683 RepID=A0A427YQ87_9TREE|nr:hypothetical protein EHS25_007574 [Saitozyma podzolica]